MATPRKTIEAHKLTGTVSQATDGPAEHAQEFATGRPAYPKGISPEAKKVFKRLCGLLEQRRHITPGDAELLRLYAVVYTRHEQCLKKIDEQGVVCLYTRLDSNGQPHEVEKENLHVKIAGACEKTLVSCLDRLGLTPINKSKVKTTGAPEKPADPMDELVRRAAFVQPVSDAPVRNTERYQLSDFDTAGVGNNAEEN